MKPVVSVGMTAYDSPGSLLLQLTTDAAEVQALSDRWTFDTAPLLCCMLRSRYPKTALYADMQIDKIRYGTE